MKAGNVAHSTSRLVLCALLIVGAGTAPRHGAAQQIQLGGFDRASEAKKPHVSLLSDAVTVQAGKAQDVELRFHVDEGFHINSHTPKDELLLPTMLKLDGSGGTKLLGEIYPPGSAFRLDVGAGEILDVYQGEFRIAMRVVAPHGASTLDGVLKYQACDKAACYPPRTLPVHIAITGN